MGSDSSSRSSTGAESRRGPQFRFKHPRVRGAAGMSGSTGDESTFLPRTTTSPAAEPWASGVAPVGVLPTSTTFSSRASEVRREVRRVDEVLRAAGLAAVEGTITFRCGPSRGARDHEGVVEVSFVVNGGALADHRASSAAREEGANGVRCRRPRLRAARAPAWLRRATSCRVGQRAALCIAASIAGSAPLAAIASRPRSRQSCALPSAQGDPAPRGRRGEGASRA